MRGGLKAADLADLELAYAPQFGSAKDPINMLGFIDDNLSLSRSVIHGVEESGFGLWSLLSNDSVLDWGLEPGAVEAGDGFLVRGRRG